MDTKLNISQFVLHANSGQGNLSLKKVLMDDPRFRIKPIQQVASACTGALITALFMTPLDVVKTRLQAQQSSMSHKCFLYCNGLMDHLCPCDPNTNKSSPTKPPRLNGTIDAFIKISRTEGVGSLWSGLSPTMISALPSTVIYFVAYEQFKMRSLEFYYKYLAEEKGSPRGRDTPVLIPMLSGISARLCSVTVVSPVELIRTKMQSQKMTNGEMLASLRMVAQTQGMRGLFKGLPPTILRDVPFSGIYWTCYEAIKNMYNVVEPSFSFSFFAGAISGSVAATVTTPFDVVKTHDQIEFGERVIFTDHPVKNAPTPSLLQRLHTIYRMNGVKGLFSGLGPRLLKVAPACAIMISTFEYSKAFFYHYNIHLHNENVMIMKNKHSGSGTA